MGTPNFLGADFGGRGSPIICWGEGGVQFQRGEALQRGAVLGQNGRDLGAGADEAGAIPPPGVFVGRVPGVSRGSRRPQTIKCLLIQPNPESALNEEAARLLLEDFERFAARARLLTEIHARAPPLPRPDPPPGPSGGSPPPGTPPTDGPVPKKHAGDRKPPPKKKGDKKRALRRL